MGGALFIGQIIQSSRGQKCFVESRMIMELQLSMSTLGKNHFWGKVLRKKIIITCCVPQGEFEFISIDVDCFDFEVDTNSGSDVGIKQIISESD